MTGGVKQADLVVIYVENEVIVVKQVLVLIAGLEAGLVDLRTIAAEDEKGVVAGHDAAVARELPSSFVIKRRDELGVVEVDERAAVVLGENCDGITGRNVQPFDAVDEDLVGLGIVDVRTVFVSEAVSTNFFAIETFLDGFRGCTNTAGEG